MLLQSICSFFKPNTGVLGIQSSRDNSNLDDSKNLTTRIVFYSSRKFFPYEFVKYLE
jgi:hypothetical protein